jgi:predicted metal-dependent hydrolase
MNNQYWWNLDGILIPVTVILSQRKTNVIVVKPDMTLEFRGRLQNNWEDIEVALDKKAHLIRKKLSYFEQFDPPIVHNYENGETFYYLGRQYRLKIIASNQSRIRLIGKWFVAELPDPEHKDKIKIMLDKWFRTKAVYKISERMQKYFHLLSHRITDMPMLAFRKMKTRWGSCSHNRIVFNTELVKTPVICIDYIVVHELCHLLYPHHNKAFYRRLTQIMPDWKQRKHRLEHART